MVLHKVSAFVETERETVLYSKHFVTSQKCPYHVTFELTSTLTLSKTWMWALLGTIVCKFGGHPDTSVIEEAIRARVYRQTDRRRTPHDALAHRMS